VNFFPFVSSSTLLIPPFPPRKSAANILAVDERQSLDTLTRDEKTAARVLTQLAERQHGMEEKRGQRNEELRLLGERRTEVCWVFFFRFFRGVWCTDKDFL
jgi:hypothetical protein